MLTKALFVLINAALYIRHREHVRKFRSVVGYYPNIAVPRRYSEIMLWRKLFDHNPRFTIFCDKLATKDYVRSLCPGLAIPATLWSGKEPTQIPSSLIAAGGMIKANHASRRNYRLSGDQTDSLPHHLFKRWAENPFGVKLLEWGYSAARRLLLVEEIIKGKQGKPLMDLSVHCFSGTPGFIEVNINPKSKEKKKGYFRTSGERWLEIERDHGRNAYALEESFVLPDIYQAAMRYSKMLSRALDYVRVDFLYDGVELFAGEITVYPGSGLVSSTVFKNNNEVVESLWNIRNSWFLQQRHSGWRKLYACALLKKMSDK